jgi:hypothetical protein
VVRPQQRAGSSLSGSDASTGESDSPGAVQYVGFAEVAGGDSGGEYQTHNDQEETNYQTRPVDDAADNYQNRPAADATEDNYQTPELRPSDENPYNAL